MENIKVIDNKSKNYYLDEHEMGSSGPSLTTNINRTSIQRNHRQSKIKLKYFIFPILSIVLVGIIILVVILACKNGQREENESQNDISIIENPPLNNPEESNGDGNEQMDFKDLILKYGPIELDKAYKIKTNVNDLKRIYI